MARASLFLMRHGESVWNQLHKFTGWVDISLSNKGIEEARNAGKSFSSVAFDRVFTSSLLRAQMTAMIALLENGKKSVGYLQNTQGSVQGENSNLFVNEAIDQMVPVIPAWELNERFYGQLQGMNKAQAEMQFGKELVQTWRRSFDTPPPGGESLQQTRARVVQYFQKHISPRIVQSGENILVVAHGNSLRALVMDLESLTPEEVSELELATGTPLVYHYTSLGWKKAAR